MHPLVLDQVLFLKEELAELYKELHMRLTMPRLRYLGKNPIPYYAPYFGYKVHMDPNEKIDQDYGCTHVGLIDGYSRMVCLFASMK